MTFGSTKNIKHLLLFFLIVFFAFGCSGGGSGGSGGSDGTTDSGDTTNPLGLSIISPAANQTITKGDSVTFRGSASKGTPDYSFAWNFDEAARNYQETGPAPLEHVITFNKTGSYDVSLTATDETGTTGSASVTITVRDWVDTEPIVTIVSPSGDPVTIPRGSSIDFNIQVQGGNGPFTFSLDFPDEVARDYYAENATTPPSPSITFNTPGTFDVTFRAIDADSDEHTDSVTIIVQ